MNDFDYPILIGGKPMFSTPMSVVPSYILLVLAAALGAFIGMIALNQLPRHHHPLFARARFALGRAAVRAGFAGRRAAARAVVWLAAARFAPTAFAEPRCGCGELLRAPRVVRLDTAMSDQPLLDAAIELDTSMLRSKNKQSVLFLLETGPSILPLQQHQDRRRRGRHPHREPHDQLCAARPTEAMGLDRGRTRESAAGVSR
jgi:hypothetical protein